MWKPKLVTSITSHRVRIGCVVMCLLASSSSGAQTPLQTGIRLDTGLFTFFAGDGRSVSVTVTEVGDLPAVSNVLIVFLDATNRTISRGEGVLKRGQPVSLELPLDMAERRVKVRASITIVGQPGRISSPIVVLEDIDPGSFTIQPRVSCSAPTGREGPVMPYCPDVSATSITLGS